MGCDIHLYAETLDPASGVWQAVLIPGHVPDPEDYSDTSMRRFDQGRSYDVFAILASVRNGRGFAGIKTGEGFNPISMPRGVPGDASPEFKALVDAWSGDGHSHSWLLLNEVLSYDWTQAVTRQGYISLERYSRWRRWSRGWDQSPDQWAADIDGPNIKKVTMAEADKLLERSDDVQKADTINYQVLAIWEQPYHRAASLFWSEYLPPLLALRPGHPEQVRLVFFFDN